eukprot:2819942-Pyramimonas_sp.AAC.1
MRGHKQASGLAGGRDRSRYGSRRTWRAGPVRKATPSTRLPWVVIPPLAGILGALTSTRWSAGRWRREG